MTDKRKEIPYSDRFSYLWLLSAFVLTLFSTGRLTVPVTAWFSSIFAIRFMRTQKRGFVAYLLIALTVILTMAVSWHGMIAVPPPADIVFMIISGLIAALPFLADRYLVPRLKGLWSTLAFPLASSVIEFLNMGSGSPVGSFGALAYSQYYNLILLQLLSLTGMWGVSFLMNWFASTVNWLWENSFEWKKSWPAIALYGGILFVVLAFGGARLTFSHPKAGTVRVASFTSVSVDIPELLELLKTDQQSFRDKVEQIHNRFFEQTIREAKAGAKIILWPEGAGIGTEDDESSLMERGKEIAGQLDIYLAVPFFTLYNHTNRPAENKLIIFDPSGKTVLEHVKYGGNIFEGSKQGDGVLQTVSTPYGTLSGAICWDTDFIKNIAQAGRNGTDILLSPAHDWKALDPLHGQMSAFRAIENGITVIRQADKGLSLISDPYGRTLATTDHFTSDDHTMVAQVPVKGVRTVYSIIGDLFGWLFVGGFVVMTILVVIRRK